MSSKLVLVVDDNEHDREIYGTLLWYNGFDIIVATDGEMGYWLAREARPDLILRDLGLPDVEGLAVCRRLRAEEETAGIPMIVLSARAEHEFGERARALGCVGYIEKPTLPLDVLRQVEKVIGPAARAEVGLRRVRRVPEQSVPPPIRLMGPNPHATDPPAAGDRYRKGDRAAGSTGGGEPGQAPGP